MDKRRARNLHPVKQKAVKRCIRCGNKHGVRVIWHWHNRRRDKYNQLICALLERIQTVLPWYWKRVCPEQCLMTARGPCVNSGVPSLDYRVQFGHIDRCQRALSPHIVFGSNKGPGESRGKQDLPLFDLRQGIRTRSYK
jgi:hypothetical protein